MNQMKQEAVALADLRQLGRQGGVTARLEDGSDMKLYPRFGTISRKGYIAGELTTVEVVTEYNKVYSQIRTIKREGVLIARREKVGKQFLLKLTGKGYKRS